MSRWKGLVETGNRLERQNLCADALKMYLESLESAPKHHRIGIYYRIACLQFSMGDFQSAEDYFRRTLDDLDRFKVEEEKDTKAKTLLCLGKISFQAGMPLNALNRFKKALESADSPMMQAASLKHLAETYSLMDHKQRADECYDAAVKIARSQEDLQFTSETLAEWGRFCASTNRNSKAFSHLSAALEIAEAMPAACDIARQIVELGRNFKNSGEYKNAIKCYETALPIFRHHEDMQGKASVLCSLGILYKNMGKHDQAIEYCAKALELDRSACNKEGEAIALIGLGQAYQYSGRYEDAETAFIRAIEVQKEFLGEPRGLTCHVVGHFYLDWALQYDPDQPHECAQRAARIKTAEQFIRKAGNSSSMGRLLLINNKLQDAKQSYENLAQDEELRKLVYYQFAAYTGLGRVHEELNLLEEAKHFYLRAFEFSEDLRNLIYDNHREQFFDVKFEGFSRTAPYEGLSRIYYRLAQNGDDTLDDALRISEYTKARVFSEFLLAKSDYRKLNQLTAIEKGETETGSDAVWTKTDPTKAKLRDELQKSALSLRKFSNILDRDGDPKPLFGFYGTEDLHRVQPELTMLNPEEWLLVYDVLETGLLIYLIHENKIAKCVYKPTSRNRLNDLVLEFRRPLDSMTGFHLDPEKLSEFGSESQMKVASELSGILLGDVLDDLQAGVSVTIVPDEILGIVPFEMLVLKPGKVHVKRNWIDNRFLSVCCHEIEFFGDRNFISYYPSLTALKLNRNNENSRPIEDGLILTAHEEFAVYADQVMASLQDLYPNTNCRTLSKTGKDVLLRDLERFGTILFIAHGELGIHSRPVLKLSSKIGLSIREVMDLELNADLTALIACHSGIGGHVSGEGIMGMGAAFRFAGSKSVLMSLWPVSVGPSSNFVKYFLQHIHQGNSKLESLMMARHQLRCEDGFDHPYYWASFVLVGDVS